MDGFLSPGKHVLEFENIDKDGRKLKSGLYILRAIVGSEEKKIKIFLVK